MMLEYPANRPKVFALKVACQMINMAAGQALGAIGYALVNVIAAKEDELRYSRPVEFWDPQLMMILGIRKQHELAAGRVKAVKAGWLQYKHGTKGEPGLYFVTIPGYASALFETTSFVDDDEVSDISQTNPKRIPNESQTQVEQKPNESQTQVKPFIPNPIPDPIPNPEVVSSPSATQPTAEVFLNFPVAGTPGSWDLTIPQVVEWGELYPSIDIRAECRKALAWVKANHKKTAKGMSRFLVNWLSQATDRGKCNGKTAGTGATRTGARELIQENPASSESEDDRIFAAAAKRNAERLEQETASGVRGS